MKKVLVVLTVVAVLGLGAVAFAAWGGPGYGYGGYAMGPGMMYGYGPGYGPMMGYGYGYGATNSAENQKFLKDTADLRQTINQKRFDYAEAVRNGDEKKAEALSKELDDLYNKLSEKAPEGYTGNGYARGGYGYGPMMGYGYGYGCGW